jgi:hypothetical protein
MPDLDTSRCLTDGNLTICLGPKMRVVKEERQEPIWCFGERRRVGGVHQLWSPVGMSYYDPHWSYTCDGCGDDRRLGFGRVWMWDEEYADA